MKPLTIDELKALKVGDWDENCSFAWIFRSSALTCQSLAEQGVDTQVKRIEKYHI